MSYNLSIYSFIEEYRKRKYNMNKIKKISIHD